MSAEGAAGVGTNSPPHAENPSTSRTAATGPLLLNTWGTFTDRGWRAHQRLKGGERTLIEHRPHSGQRLAFRTCAFGRGSTGTPGRDLHGVTLRATGVRPMNVNFWTRRLTGLSGVTSAV